MTDHLSAEQLSDVEPAQDPDDLVGGGTGFSTRWRLAVAVLALVAVGAGIYFARSADGPAGTRAAAVTDGGDLGAQSDAMSLSERLAPELAEREGSPSGSLAPGSVACDDSEAALPQDQAELIYSARLEWEGTPAVVLGYRVDGPSLSRLLLVLAEEDCRLIVTQSF